MTKRRIRAPRSVLLIAVATMTLHGCSVMRPEPKPLYPDGPELAQPDAATVSLLAFPDVPRSAGRVAWAATKIVPQFPAESLGEQQLPSTWVVVTTRGLHL